MNIHQNHKRTIEITFWMLDELLCSFKRWANGEEIYSLLFKELNNLTNEQRLELHNEITTLQNLLKKVKEDLKLQGYTQNIGMALQGSAALFEEDIADLKGKRLSAYGDPSKELVAYLDPLLDEFNKHLSRISHIGTEAMQKK